MIVCSFYSSSINRSILYSNILPHSVHKYCTTTAKNKIKKSKTNMNKIKNGFPIFFFLLESHTLLSVHSGFLIFVK